MKTIDEPMPICEAEMERLEDQLVEDCKSLGMAESIRDFLQEPFSEWMDELADESSGGDDSSPECRLSRNGAGALAIAMQQTMAVRDALLVSIIVDERRSSRDFLMGFMANPTLPGNTRHLEESLNGSFRDASRKARHETLRQRRQHDVRHHRDGPRTVSCAAIGHHQLCAVVDGR